MTPWLDSHAHLDDPDVPPHELHDSLQRLVDAGWPGTLTAGYGPERFEYSRQIAETWPMVRRAIGMHPEYLARLPDDHARDAAQRAMCAELAHPSVVALGEIGLDQRFQKLWPLSAQLHYFEAGLREAAARRLPVVLHIVRWHGHALELLRRVGVPFGGAVHRWSGPLELVPAYEALGLGIAMSLEPHETVEKRQRLAQTIAPNRLLLETDWPFLHLHYDEAVAQMTQLGTTIADWRGDDPAGLQVRLAENARNLYHFAP
jgi:TatD DNase family protein